LLKQLNRLIQYYGIGGINKSLHLAVSQSFVALLFILIDFIFSKQLTVAEFGIWKEIFFFFNLGIPLLAFGLPEGYKYFIAKGKNLTYYFKNLISVLLLIGLLLFVVIAFVNFLHWSDVININSYFGYSLLFPLPLIAFLLNKTLRYSYINLNEAEKLTKLSLFGALLSLVSIVIGTIYIKEHQDMVVLVAIFIYFSVFFFPALFYLKSLPVASFKLAINKKAVKQILVYGLPLYLATFAGLLSNYLDKLIVNVFTDDVTFAIFSVGAFEIPIFAMLSAAFSQQIFPKMVRLVEENDEDKAKSLWMETTKKVSLITYPVILLVMIFAEELIFFVYNKSYEASIILFKTYLLVAMFRNNSYGILLTAKGNTKLITKISIVILLLNIIFSTLLFYYFGLNGVIFGTLISTFLFTTYVLYREDMIIEYMKNILLSKKIAVLISLILIVYFWF
jgi:O-antigen/teichoic acid export membrane protein